MTNLKINTIQNVYEFENLKIIRFGYFKEHMQDLQYYIRFCECGRIHYISKEAFDWMEMKPSKRRILHFCQNCGTVQFLYLEKYMGELHLYIEEIHDSFEFGGEGLGFEYKVLGDVGLLAMGNNGSWINYAEWYEGVDTFYTEEGWTTFSAEWFIKDVKLAYGPDRRMFTGKDNMAEDLLKAISSYKSGINWKGTPYEGCDIWEF